MKPISFPEANVVFAKDQPEYLPLPAHRSDDGQVISCWRLSWRERLKVLFTGRLWLSIMTFNQPLQPQLPMVDSPWAEMKCRVKIRLDASPAVRHLRWVVRKLHRDLLVSKVKEYLCNRFYLRGTSALGILNTVTGCLFNRVLVKHVDDMTGRTMRWTIGMGTKFPPRGRTLMKRALLVLVIALLSCGCAPDLLAPPKPNLEQVGIQERPSVTCPGCGKQIQASFWDKAEGKWQWLVMTHQRGDRLDARPRNVVVCPHCGAGS